MNTPHRQTRTYRFGFLLIGFVLSFSLNANQTQAQKITVEVNVSCDDSGVNDAQVWIGGTLVDLSAPPRAIARVEIAPGTYVIKASRKSFPNAVVKDIYASNLDDQFPRK